RSHRLRGSRSRAPAPAPPAHPGTARASLALERRRDPVPEPARSRRLPEPGRAELGRRPADPVRAAREAPARTARRVRAPLRHTRLARALRGPAHAPAQGVGHVMRRHLRRVAPVLGCLLAGSLLLFLAVSAARWQDALASGDARYRRAPDGRLWDPGRLAVGSISKPALGIDDDLGFRHAVQSFSLSHPEQPANSNPALVVYRNEATVALTDIERHAKDPEWRSTAANLLGVLSYS